MQIKIEKNLFLRNFLYTSTTNSLKTIDVYKNNKLTEKKEGVINQDHNDDTKILQCNR